MRIDGRFRGPPDSGNGGWVAGVLAGALGHDGPVEVRLSAPPPLERELRIDHRDGGAALLDGDVVLAGARPAALELELPPAVTPAEAAAATARTPMRADRHPFPTCFGCGPLREAGDALRHLPGPVDGRDDVVACPMTTDPRLPRDGDALRPEVVWAALDCPSAAAVIPPGEPAHVLGTIVAHIERPVVAGEPHVCVAWRIAAEGRKRTAGSAVLDAQGRVCARARAVWIRVLR